jgi:Amt family ammonium transporter
LKRHVVRGDHKRTPRYDIRSLCNGYLSGIAAVSAGAAIMPPWGAVVTGLIQSPFYMICCYVFKKVKFDDPMENFQVYATAGFWSMLASIFFWPDSGILWGGKDSGSLLGIQLLGFATMSCWTIIIAWLYFFSLKRCRVLKLTKA